MREDLICREELMGKKLLRKRLMQRESHAEKWLYVEFFAWDTIQK
jgi:hypothetical protein